MMRKEWALLLVQIIKFSDYDDQKNAMYIIAIETVSRLSSYQKKKKKTYEHK